MYDPNQIAVETISGVQRHFNELAMQLLYGEGSVADPIAPLADSPLRRRIELLVSVANGEAQNQGEVAEALLSVTTVTDRIPRHYVHPHLWQVIDRVQLWLDRDELITLSEAARLLRGTSETRNLKWLYDRIKKGVLKRYTDPSEPNPQRAGRVSRKAVNELKRKAQ